LGTCFPLFSDLGAHPAPFLMGTAISYHGGKGPGCEAEHAGLSSAEVKNVWGYTSTPNTSAWRGA